MATSLFSLSNLKSPFGKQTIDTAGSKPITFTTSPQAAQPAVQQGPLLPNGNFGYDSSGRPTDRSGSSYQGPKLENGNFYSNQSSIGAPKQGSVLGASTGPSGSGGGGGSTPASGGGNPVGDAADAQRSAAEVEAEARRQAALGAYQAQQKAGEAAKDTATGRYNWLIDTIGSNKQDALSEVALNETQGLQGYEKQKVDTEAKYDEARGEILSTYRDLTRQQEKILRGTGVANSSRSQEAALRLNSLMGKDLSSLSKNEADSLALIGEALQTFKTQITNTKNKITNEAQQRLDAAALEYDAQIKQIDQNLFLSDLAKEDQLREAEVALAQNIANIETWVSSIELQQAETQARITESMNDFILGMTDSNTALNADLATKRDLTNKVLAGATQTALDKETQAQLPQGSGGTSTASKYNSLQELQAALQRGEIDQGTYNRLLGSVQQTQTNLKPVDYLAQAATPQTIRQNVSNDTLINSIFQQGGYSLA